MIRFIAVNRTQERYFKTLTKTLTTPCDVTITRRLFFPCIRGLFHLREIDVMGVISRKHHELANANHLLSTPLLKPFYTLYLFFLIPFTLMRYDRAVSDARVEGIGLWNGKHFRQSLLKELALCYGKKVLYFENGVLPNTTVCDPKGVNAHNSVPRNGAFYDHYHSSTPFTPPVSLITRSSIKGIRQENRDITLPTRYLFIPMQVNHDTQITHHSPYFPNMTALFSMLYEVASNIPKWHFILKEHPSDPADYGTLHAKASSLPNLTFMNDVPTQYLIEHATYVATINSTVGIEAMLFKTPVLLLGDAFFNIPEITYPITSAHDLIALLQSQTLWQPNQKRVHNLLHFLQSDYLIQGHWKTPDETHIQGVESRIRTLNTPPTTCVLFLVSTPLHLYNAITVALMNPEWESHLFYIDQPQVPHHLYYEALQQWETCPFNSIALFKTRLKGSLAKLKARHEAFRELRIRTASIMPSRIYVGNDRRIEFAYTLHIAKRFQPSVIGGYLDDGVYTYITQKSKWHQDTFIDIGLKKLIYGLWYFRPSIVGGSDAVQEAYITLPEYANPILKTKQCIPLKTSVLTSPQLSEFSQALLEPFDLDIDALKKLSFIITLPHESLFERSPHFKEAIIETVKEACVKGASLGVKYHPRQEHPDPLNLRQYGKITLLPGALAFEALLPLLHHPIIIGDVSTALLTARWLRPDLRVLSLQVDNDARQVAMMGLFNHCGITLIQPKDLSTYLDMEP